MASQLAFTPTGKEILISDEASYTLFERASRRKVWDWRSPGYFTSQFALAPDGRHVALCNSNGTIYIVRLKEATKP